MAAALIALVSSVIVAAITAVTSVASWMGQTMEDEKAREQARAQELEDQQYYAEREDTTYQRRVEDMKAAGINPLMSVLQGTQVQTAPAHQPYSTQMPNMGEMLGNVLSGVGGEVGGLMQADKHQAFQEMIQGQESVAKIAEMEAETGVKKREQILQEQQQRLNELEFNYREQKLRVDLDQSLANLDLTKANERLAEEKINELIHDYGFKASQEQRDKARLAMQQELKKSQIELENWEKMKINAGLNSSDAAFQEMKKQKEKELKQKMVEHWSNWSLKLMQIGSDMVNGIMFWKK